MKQLKESLLLVGFGSLVMFVGITLANVLAEVIANLLCGGFEVLLNIL